VLQAVSGGGARTVALCHNVAPHEPRSFDTRLLSTLLRRVDGVLVHSAAERDKALDLTTRPVRTADLPPLRPSASDPVPAPDAPYRRILFFGIVRPYKGLDVLLRAMARLAAPVELVVAGEFWGGTAGTERLIGELGLTGRVQIRPGYVSESEVRDLFGEVDALVLPYRSATSSAMAWIGFEHGVPVIATRAGTLADAVTDGVDGLVCRPDDVDDLALALGRFYEPGVALRLRAAVRPVDPERVWAPYLERLLSFVY
jgi:glycosyltransferase involved in cell wall biosynthesis